MHPILAQRGRLGVYFLAWAPLNGLLVLLLVNTGGWGWMEAVALVTPLCALYALVCLSAWYPVRAAPVSRQNLVRVLFTHLAAALVVSALWTAAGYAWASTLSGFADLEGFEQRFQPQIPLLFGIGALLYLLSVALHYALAAFEASREAERREDEARVLARDAELKALKAQVNPHFLFNSLNSISALTSVNPAQAREMCVLLSEFLRTTLGMSEKAAIPMEEELGLARAFLAIEKVRFGARLVVEECVQDECRAASVPPLLLQPLVENAVTHGIGNLLEGGVVRIAVRRAGDDVVVAIENSFDPDAARKGRSGMGLANVRGRLEARYGDRGRLRVQANGERYIAEASFPAETQRGDAL